MKTDRISGNTKPGAATGDKLKLSEQSFRSLIENSSDMLSVSNDSGVITYLSPNISKILGYSPEAFDKIRKNEDFFYPGYQILYDKLSIEVRQNPGKNYPFTSRIKHALGHWLWIEGTVTNLLNISAVNGVVTNFRDITDRKTAQDSLQESEERYRQIVETAQEGIWMMDEQFLIVFVNQKVCDILGYPAREIIGKYSYDFKDAEGTRETLERFKKVRSGATETHESVYITKSGKRVIASVTTNGIFDADNNYKGTLAMMTDITQRKHDEEALKRSEANLFAIIENTDAQLYSLDTELRYITFNTLFKNKMRTVYGADIKQGDKTLEVLEILKPQEAEEWRAIYTQVLTGQSLQFVKEFDEITGTEFISFSLNPIRDHGEIIGISCFSKDITQQKTDEITLKKSEASLRTIFNNTELAYLLIDTDLKILSFNKLAQMFSEEQNGKTLVEGYSVFNYFDEERLQFILDVLKSTQAGETVNYQISREINGTVKWFDIIWAGIKNNKNENLGYLLSNKDITGQKKSEIEREKITADLIQRNKDLEQFTYIISHNLRAPVANIIGLSSLLNSLDPTDVECPEIVNSINVTAHKLDNVISDLNQILQVNSRVNEKIELVVFDQLVNDIKLSISQLIIQTNATIICDFAGEGSMYTLKSYMHSIFYNLILNSIKYRQLGVAPVIMISSKPHNKQLTISYKDNGRGIDTVTNAKNLFGLYKRFDTSVEGKGMGLFMVKMQVESLGGTITLKSELNKGTSFELEFPLEHTPGSITES